MTIAELIWHGLELLAVGMGTVAVFLTVLVFAVILMSKLAAWLESLWPPEAAPAAPAAPPAVPAAHLAAISAAVHRYRTTPKPN